MAVKFLCACCGQKTLECEDDPLQRDEPDYQGGTNQMSLNEAKEAYKNELPIE